LWSGAFLVLFEKDETEFGEIRYRIAGRVIGRTPPNPVVPQNPKSREKNGYYYASHYLLLPQSATYTLFGVVERSTTTPHA
jgi:hypothetical protein